MLFGHLTSMLHLGRLRLRGPSRAQFEFSLATIVQNCSAPQNLPRIRRRTQPSHAWRAVAFGILVGERLAPRITGTATPKAAITERTQSPHSLFNC